MKSGLESMSRILKEIYLPEMAKLLGAKPGEEMPIGSPEWCEIMKSYYRQKQDNRVWFESALSPTRFHVYQQDLAGQRAYKRKEQTREYTYKLRQLQEEYGMVSDDDYEDEDY